MAQQTARIVADDVMGGIPRIAGHRVTVLDVHEQVEGRGLAAADVADRYGLDVADIYHALAYYHDHPEEMREAREQRTAAVEAARDGVDE